MHHWHPPRFYLQTSVWAFSDKPIHHALLNIDYKVHMGSFYNYFQTEFRYIYDGLAPDVQKKIRGATYSLLCNGLNFLLDKGKVTLDDVLFIEASGQTYKDEANLLGLYDYYQSIGFKANPEYIRRYKQVCADIDAGRYTVEDYDENIDPDKENDADFVDLGNIPMYATVRNLVAVCQEKNKHPESIKRIKHMT